MARSSIRDRILDAAVRTLHHRGFHGCAVQDITDAAGVPKGSFYNYFISKEALGAAALDRYWQQCGTPGLALLSDTSLSPLTRLRRYFAAVTDDLARRDYCGGCLVGNMSAEMADDSRLIGDRLAAICAGWTRVLQACLREGQRSGEIRGDLDAAALASLLVNAWQGSMLRARVDKDGSALAHFQDIVFKVISA